MYVHTFVYTGSTARVDSASTSTVCEGRDELLVIAAGAGAAGAAGAGAAGAAGAVAASGWVGGSKPERI